VIKPKRPSPTASPLLFEIDPEPITETLTAWGGVPLAVQAFRSLGLPASIERHVHIKQRERGYEEATMVESFVVLNALGGECLEDFTHLREDGGLKEMLGTRFLRRKRHASFFTSSIVRRRSRKPSNGGDPIKSPTFRRRTTGLSLPAQNVSLS
jgi:hypothetical protein